jgi:hypothetical protein
MKIRVNTSEVAEILKCTRQNVDDLIRRKKLNPIKVFPKGNIFLKSDVIRRTKQIDN